MNKTIYDQFDKKIISTLPKEIFPGRIFTITTESEAIRAVDYLMDQSILGFDSETRPSFKRKVSYKVALLQVSTYDTCFLFRLDRIGLPDCIIRLLEDKSIIKVGLSLKDDFMMLMKRRKFRQGTFIDLQNEIKDIGIKDCALQKIYANLFVKKISKRQQLSNWEADILSDSQKAYAALDAWACVMIHNEIQRLKQTNDYTLIIKSNKEKEKDNTNEIANE